jgi:DNA primase
VEARVRTVEAVRSIVRAAPPGLARDLYIDKVAQKLGAPPDAVRMALEAPARVEQGSARPTPLPQRPPIRAGAARMAAGTARQRSAGEDADKRPQGLARSPARPEAAPSRPQAPRPAARRSAPQIELKIVAQMLQGTELSLLVESSGAAARFTHAGLRELAERAFAQARAGSLDAAALVQSVEHDALRDALGKVIDEIDAAGRGVERDQAFLATARRALESVLRKHASVAGQEEIGQRNAAAAPRVAHGDGQGGQKTGA